MRPAQRRGFTLIELLIVIAVIGVLAAVVLIAINPVRRLAQARDAGRKSDVGQIATASQAYYVTNGRYPTDMNELTASQDLKTNVVPPAPAGGGCNNPVAPHEPTTFDFDNNATTSELSVQICLEAPNTSGFTAPGAWAWCSVTGTSKELDTALLSVCTSSF